LRQRAAHAGGSANNHLVLHILKTLVLYFCLQHLEIAARLVCLPKLSDMSGQPLSLKVSAPQFSLVDIFGRNIDLGTYKGKKVFEY
jgi:hypothetical protein